MPHEAASARSGDRIAALLVVCVLAAASLVIALLGAAPERVGAGELLGSARAPGQAAFIASHRGGAALAPENTLPAVARALGTGFGYVEVDVALTADRQPVLMHDATVDRTTDGHGALAALTLAQVRRLDAGSWFGRRFAGTRVPTLAEFLDLLAARHGRALVELKGPWDEASVAAAIGEVARRGLERRIAVMSFDARTLALVESASPIVSRLAILRQLPDDVVEAVRGLGARGVIVSGRAVRAHPEVVDRLHAAGLRVVVYTLNSGAQWDAATGLGVDGIVTDEPVRLEEWQARSTVPPA